MRIARNKQTLATAIIAKCGNGYLITIGSIRKYFDKETTATNYIINQGFIF